MSVGFIGLGIMGSRMARNLVKAQIPLTVFNRSQRPFEKLDNAGWKIEKSARECVNNQDIVITMLSTEAVVEEVAFGETGFVNRMKANAIWVDCSTVSPHFSLRMAERAAEHGIRFIDAPVAGSKYPAEQGDLVFLVGGDQSDISEVQHLFEIMGKKTVHAGSTSKGSALKTIVNSLLGQAMLIYTEAVELGKNLELSEELLYEALPNFPVVAPYLKGKADKLRNGKTDEVEFPLEWMTKDLEQFKATAEHMKSPTFLCDEAIKTYKRALDLGMAREDFSAVVKLLD